MIRSVAYASSLVLALFGCGGSSVDPLGGPYGGEGHAPDPSNKAPDPGSNSGCTSSTDDAGSSPASVADSGDDETDASSYADASSGTSSDAGGSAPAATWAQIYQNYLPPAVCAGAGCHIEMSTANDAYSWLRAQGYINGKNSTLVSTDKSCLKWFGGNMPPCGGGGNNAVSDMSAWVAAGAANN